MSTCGLITYEFTRRIRLQKSAVRIRSAPPRRHSVFSDTRSSECLTLSELLNGRGVGLSCSVPVSWQRGERRWRSELVELRHRPNACMGRRGRLRTKSTSKLAQASGLRVFSIGLDVHQTANFDVYGDPCRSELSGVWYVSFRSPVRDGLARSDGERARTGIGTRAHIRSTGVAGEPSRHVLRHASATAVLDLLPSEIADGGSPGARRVCPGRLHDHLRKPIAESLGDGIRTRSGRR